MLCPTLARIFQIAAVCVVFTSGPALAQGWIEYENREDRFRVNFPGEPTVETISWPGEYGATFPGRIYRYQAGESRYEATVIDYTKTRELHADIEKNEAELGGGQVYADLEPIGAIQYAATKLYRQRPGAQVTYDAFHYIDFVSGQMLQLTNADQSRSFVGIYVHDMRLYIFEATVPAGAPPPGLFQQSPSFLDADGNRVRYDNIYFQVRPPRPGRDER